MQINLKNKQYSVAEFKTELENATPAFDRPGAARKINFDKGKVRYNEILAAVKATIDITANNPNEDRTPQENDDLRAIYGKLQSLKDQGHESDSFGQMVYNLFRRYFPNWSRESDLAAIGQTLTTKFPTAKELQLNDERVRKEQLQRQVERRQNEISRGESRYKKEVSQAIRSRNVEKLAEAIYDQTDYIQKHVYGLNDPRPFDEVREPTLTALKKVVEDVKQMPKDLYEEYVKKYLQNPERTPVIQLGQAAILADYLTNNGGTRADWIDFWIHLRADITGIVFVSMHESSWSLILNRLLLPQIEELAGLDKEEAPEDAVVKIGVKEHKTKFASRIVDPVTKEEVSPAPYLHKLWAIYAVMTEEQRAAHFHGLKMRNRGGGVQVSTNGRDWQEFFSERI